ncbi:MAG: hypothetical protein ACU843_07845 [Gammaproteobacteria bacterium]
MFDNNLELVAWTSRAIHPTKCGQIPTHYPKILDRPGIDGKQFIIHAARLLKEFGSAISARDRRWGRYARGANRNIRAVCVLRKSCLPQSRRPEAIIGTERTL